MELVVKEGRTIVSVKNEFGLGNGNLNDWIKQYKSRLTFPDVNVNINMYIFACLNLYKFNHFLY